MIRGRAVIAASLSLLLLAACGDAPARRDPGEIVIGTEGAYPPWNLTRADGSLDGFEPELLRDLCRRAGLRCRLVAQDWNGMIAALEARKIDMIADSVIVTPARRAVVTFSTPYARTASVFVTANPAGGDGDLGPPGRTIDYDRPTPAGTADLAALKRRLRGRTIGVQASGVYEDYLNANFAGIATIRTYRTGGERDLDLILGRIDLMLEDSAYVGPLLDAPDAKALRITGPAIAGGMFGSGEAFAFRKGDVALKRRVDQALNSMIADGSLRRLSMKWLHEDATP